MENLLPSEFDDLSISDTIILATGASLIDILNQEFQQTTVEDDSDSVIFIEDVKSDEKQTENSESNESDKLSTLFNPTGRERNSTGPLKQWLYEHQDYPYPKESDKQELMKQTNMSAAQITIWFTNARVKLRKEKKLLLKKKKQISEVIPNPLVSIHQEIIPLKQYVLAYSSLNLQQRIDLHRFVALYPDQFSISDTIDDHTTHLIIGQETKPLLCPLTKKLFQSIARHLYIITYRWINDCLNESKILDELNYEIRGDIPYDDFHNGMKISRLSKHAKLFENCHFFVLCDHCQEYMSKDELRSLIELCHGTILDEFPLTVSNDKTILTIVLCYDICSFEDSTDQQFFELSRANGVHFLRPEWVLESIVHFQLQSFEFYETKFLNN